MKDFINQNKVFIVAVLGTLILLMGGVYLFAKDGSSPPTSKKFSEEILVPPNSNQTGPATAMLTLVEFGDYECPACGAYQPLTKQLISEFAGKINYVFRNYPLSQHKNAPISSYAAEAAALQGKFWEMHDKLYESQGDWATVGNAREIILGYAKDLGLNLTQFNTDIDSEKVKNKVAKDVADGNIVGLNATPTFYINGVKIENLPGSYDEFKNIVSEALKNIASPTASP